MFQILKIRATLVFLILPKNRQEGDLTGFTLSLSKGSASGHRARPKLKRRRDIRTCCI